MDRKKKPSNEFSRIRRRGSLGIKKAKKTHYYHLLF